MRWVGYGVVLLGFWASALPSVSHAQGAGGDVTVRAREAFEAGVAAFDAGRFEQAAKHFEEAHRLKPHPMVQVNIANCYDKLGEPLLAIEHFQAFLEADEGGGQQREEVETALQRLLDRVGRARLSVSPEGARVWVDDAEIGQAPIQDTLRLEPGRHQLRAELAGHATYRGAFTARAGQLASVQIALQPLSEAAPPVAAPPEAEPEADPLLDELADDDGAAPLEAEIESDDLDFDEASGGGGLGTRSWVALISTGTLLAGGIVMGVLAMSAEDDFKANRALANDPGQSAITRQNAWLLGRDAVETANALALTADVLFVGALIGAGVSTYFVLDDLGGGGETARGVELRLRAGPGTVGLDLGGSF